MPTRCEKFIRMLTLFLTICPPTVQSLFAFTPLCLSLPVTQSLFSLTLNLNDICEIETWDKITSLKGEKSFSCIKYKLGPFWFHWAESARRGFQFPFICFWIVVDWIYIYTAATIQYYSILYYGYQSLLMEGSIQYIWQRRQKKYV